MFNKLPIESFKNKKINIAVLIAIVLAIILYIQSIQKNKIAEAAQLADANRPIELISEDVEVIHAKNISLTVPFTGLVTSSLEAMISAPVSGIVKRVYVQEGQMVKKDDVLVEIVDTQYVAEYNEINSLLQAGKIQLEEKQYNLKQYQSLFKQGSTSEEVLRKANFEAENQQQIVNSLEAQTQLAKRLLEQTVITASISGTIGIKDVSIGQAVGEGMKLLTIIDTSRLEVRADIFSNDIQKMVIGQNAVAYLPLNANTKLHAKISRISPGAKKDSSAHSVYLTLMDNSTEIKHGMLVKGEITILEKSNVINIHRDMINTEKNQPFVYAIKNGVIKNTAITLGVAILSDNSHEIISGLNENDIIVKPSLDGIRVEGKVIVINSKNNLGE